MKELSSLVEPDFDHLVYIRIFEGCNLRCKHCFIPANPKRMSMADIADIPNKLEGKIPHGSTVMLQWHGGEPTLLGFEWLTEAIEIIEACDQYKWLHGIQTNLLTYDENWRSLYAKYFNGSVGVSYDPKIRVYNGAPDSNEKFEKIFWNNFAKLIEDDLKPYVVMTGTKVFYETFRNPFDLFNLMQEKQIKRMHIERITETGYARINWDEVGVNNKQYAQYMSRILKAYCLWKDNIDMKDYFISPFDGLLEATSKMTSEEHNKSYGCWSGACDTRFHTIDAMGYKFGCTALNSEEDNKYANNKLDINLKNISNERKERTIYNCNSCEFRTICNSGCLALDFDDGSGECSGGRTFFKELKLISEGYK